MMLSTDDLRLLSPKRIQRESPAEAVSVYAGRYREALAEGDRFLSEMYLDELLTSIILAHGHSERSRRLPIQTLKNEVRLNLEGLPREQADCLEEDLEIGLSKRFPEKYKVEETGEQERTD